MASPQVGSLPAKMSFAKIAAMPPPSQATKPTNAAQTEAQTRSKESVSALKLSHANLMASSKPQSSSLNPSQNAKTTHNNLKSTTSAIEGLALVKNAALAGEIAGSHHTLGAAGADSAEDDQSHLSNNSSHEPPGFDTKSIASVTTFAMDEKESLRPDDSASVQAVDDDDSSSVPSRNPSIHEEAENGPPHRHLQHPNPSVSGLVRRYPSITLANPPRFGDLPMSPITETEEIRQARALPQERIEMESRHLRDTTLENRTQLLAVMPDEKLLDALASPKDRLPLLQLEEKILAFLAHAYESDPDVLDLPPQNSFGRLLAHKLADYYGLQHVVGDDNTTVRLYRMRTTTINLPTPLATIASSIPSGPVPIQGSAAFKIMRRNGFGARVNSAGGSTAASSSVPSKATSENGADGSDEGFLSPPDGTPQREKSALTREEREANYKAARERIFAGFQESAPSEAASTTGDTSASISRSSSSSGKRKTSKQRRPKDDSFEARSQFVQGGFPPMPIVGQQNPYSVPYNDPSFVMPYSGTPSNTGTSFGTTPTQNYPAYDSTMQYPTLPNFHNSIQQSYSSNDQWQNTHQPPSSNYYGFPPSHTPPVYQPSQTPVNGMNQFNQPTNMVAPPASNSWVTNPYQNSYQQTPTLHNPQPVQWPSYGPSPNSASPSPYPYGQLPPQPYPNPAYNTPHPVPGSYHGNRSLFNPNSRSFVPSNTTSRSGGRNNNRKKNSNNNTNQNKQKPARGENAIAIPQRPSQPAGSNSSSPGVKDLPLQQKYGAPSHLPKKPPLPSQIPPQMELDTQALKLGSPATGSPLVVNGSGGSESRI